MRFDAGRKAAARWPLLFPEVVKTYLYIDGFNLYYGCLKDSSLKWLNPVHMAAFLLPGHSLTAVHYFSANLSARPGDPDLPVRQQTYLRALPAGSELNRDLTGITGQS